MGKLRQALRSIAQALGALPPDARVDPDQFPPDEFPVYCMQCGYDLRGLVEPRCPECGQAFDRGRLLVDQYVRCRRPRSDRRYRAGSRLSWVGCALMILLLAGWHAGWLLVVLEPGTGLAWRTLVDAWPAALLFFAAGYITSGLMTVVAVVLKLGTLPPARKRRMVAKTLRQQRKRARQARQ
jgi:hypothetical protein